MPAMEHFLYGWNGMYNTDDPDTDNARAATTVFDRSYGLMEDGGTSEFELIHEYPVLLDHDYVDAMDDAQRAIEHVNTHLCLRYGLSVQIMPVLAFYLNAVAPVIAEHIRNLQFMAGENDNWLVATSYSITTAKKPECSPYLEAVLSLTTALIPLDDSLAGDPIARISICTALTSTATQPTLQ